MKEVRQQGYKIDEEQPPPPLTPKIFTLREINDKYEALVSTARQEALKIINHGNDYSFITRCGHNKRTLKGLSKGTLMMDVDCQRCWEVTEKLEQVYVQRQ
jgi:hypothetical protein